MLFSLSATLTSSSWETPYVRWMPLGVSVSMSVSGPVGLALVFAFGFLGLWPALSEFGLGGCRRRLHCLCPCLVAICFCCGSLLVNLYLHGSCVQGGVCARLLVPAAGSVCVCSCLASVAPFCLFVVCLVLSLSSPLLVLSLCVVLFSYFGSVLRVVGIPRAPGESYIDVSNLGDSM